MDFVDDNKTYRLQWNGWGISYADSENSSNEWVTYWDSTNKLISYIFGVSGRGAWNGTIHFSINIPSSYHLLSVKPFFRNVTGNAAAYITDCGGILDRNNNVVNVEAYVHNPANAPKIEAQVGFITVRGS